MHFVYCQKGNWSNVHLMKNRTWGRWRTHFLFHRSIVTIGELHTGGSATEPNDIPIHEERVNTLSNQVILLISHVWESTNKSVEMAAPDDEVDGFLSPKQEREQGEAKKWKVHLPKFALPQLFDGTMKDTKSFVSSLILYIYGRKAEFPSNESKIMLVASLGAILHAGGESTVLEKWSHQSYCSWAGAIQGFQRFYCTDGGSVWW